MKSRERAHTCDPSTREDHDVKVTLIYIKSLRPARLATSDLASKRKKSNLKKKKKHFLQGAVAKKEIEPLTQEQSLLLKVDLLLFALPLHHIYIYNAAR